jgi:hypothetical protein
MPICIRDFDVRVPHSEAFSTPAAQVRAWLDPAIVLATLQERKAHPRVVSCGLIHIMDDPLVRCLLHTSRRKPYRSTANLRACAPTTDRLPMLEIRESL